jgi:transketolase
MHLNAINQRSLDSASVRAQSQDEALQVWHGKDERIQSGSICFPIDKCASAAALRLPAALEGEQAAEISSFHYEVDVEPRPTAGDLGRPLQTGGVTMAELCINTIRTLAWMPCRRRTPPPGAPDGVGATSIAYGSASGFRSRASDLAQRDRFVLSAGHASMLLYALLHLTGVKAVNPKYEVLGSLAVPLDDIKRFRQLDSKCPGHPEFRWTSGVETTTGPLGQGVATSVGMAIAARWGAAYFNRSDFEMFDYDVYALCGDGCMMEGISSEAASMAGHLKLANLCWIYDNNKITIEGSTALSYSDDAATRFIGHGWNVTRVTDANDLELLDRAFTTFKKTNDRPTLIIVDTHIAYGAPNKQDTSAAHGEPLGEEEIRLTKRRYRWPEDSKFLVPDGVRKHFQAGIGTRGRKLQASWWVRFEDYRRRHVDHRRDVLHLFAERPDVLELAVRGPEAVAIGRHGLGERDDFLLDEIELFFGGSVTCPGENATVDQIIGCLKAQAEFFANDFVRQAYRPKFTVQ